MKKKKTAKILVPLSLAAVCVFTMWFGTVKSPIEYTISTIANYFNQRTGFILWGVLSGLILTACALYIYKTAGFRDIAAERFLVLSYGFLILTVLVPNVKEVSWVFFYTHISTTVLFVCSLLASIVVFMRHLFLTEKELYKKALKLLIVSVAVPLSIIAIYGRLTGLAEMAFFVCMSVFFTAVNAAVANMKSRRQNAGMSAA